ncbi:hypothetical protein OVY01_18455 [Robbsia sp. Bb-Pol-6]|uniref:Winged helix-turn-helix domain-containing protein n=1 Tax=Robbsia betulipollinis TaxID=2981849 RepID=A0ABT3ZRG1_9BURK|nr:helix-turn-helix domain-containing protein [Robbsia betulipollinis]MCY0389131.1 hypothetical protein [Robbsia betulipollinis]
MDEKKGAPKSAEQIQKSGSDVNTVGTKRNRILGLFQAGASLNRFEAERFGDHCLNSTLADLRRDGYSFNQQWENVPTRFGRTARVLRYRLALAARAAGD